MKYTRLGTSVLACLLAAASLRAVDRNVTNQTELNSAITAALPGDNIILANGTYTGLNINLTCSGSSGSPITLKAATAGSVNIMGDSRVRLAGSYLIVRGLKFTNVDPVSWSNVVQFDNADNSRLTQCAFYQCGKDHWLHIVKLNNGTTNSRVDHNYFYKIQGQGIGIANNSGSADIQIDHNYLNHTEGTPNVDNGFEPIQIGQGGFDTESMRAIVEYNLIENMTDAEGADKEMISVKTADNVIRYNTLRYCDPDRGIVVRSAVNCTVDSNYVFGSYIRAYGTGHKIINNYVTGGLDGIGLPGGNGSNYATTSNCLIANNTIIDPQRNGVSFGGDTNVGGGLFAGNVTVANNLVQSSAGNTSTLYYKLSGVSGITYSANLGYASGNAIVGSSGVTVSVTSNPNLTNDGQVYRLTSTASPAKNAGIAVSAVTQDMDGQARSGTLDIGADEYSTAATTRGPLYPSDVGPAWLGGPADDDPTGAPNAAPISAFADTYAAGGATTTNYGTDAILGAKEDGTATTTYDRIAFVKFDLSSLSVAPTTATLVLTTDATTEAGALTVNQLTTDSWTETGLTWANKPAAGTTIGSVDLPAGAVADVALVVTSYVQNQFNTDSTKIVSFALTGPNAKLWLKSREAGSAYAPTLVFTGGGGSAATPALLTSVSSVTVNEGGTATFGVKLASAPSANVTVTVGRSGGDTDISVTGGASLTFTPSNWNTNQTVTLSAAEDVGTLNGVATITVSATGATSVNVTATESDNDAATLDASADTYAAGAATTTNYGTDLLLGAKEDGTTSISFDRVAYLKFDLSTLTASPTAATLQLTTDATTEAGTVTASQVTTDTWTETGLTWSNKPATGTTLGSAAVTAATSTTITINLTSYVQAQYAGDKTVTIALTGTNAKLWFKSRESGATTAPKLLITGGGL